MSYRDPSTIQGPKKWVSNVRVVYDGGADHGAVARLDWDGEPGVAIRWNGSSDNQPLGKPQSHGRPVWFRVPPEFADAVLERARELAPETAPEAAQDTALEADYRAMAADTAREQEAAEWANALVGDAVDAPG